MTTDTSLYAGQTLTLGVDGQRPVGTLASDGCCSDPICLTETQAACGILDLLPTGPMWDRAKETMRQAISANNGSVPVADVTGDSLTCPSMVNYATYVGQFLHDAVTNILAPVIREAYPHTAVDTLDDWLNRYDWVDCYRSECRSDFLGTLSPYEAVGDCGSAYSATNFSDEFENALKHAILQSLHRRRRGVIKNLDGINWVIAPLGAVLTPQFVTAVQASIDGGCSTGPDGGPQCWCEEVQFQICNVGDTLPGAPTAASLCSSDPVATVPAQQTYSRTGLADVLLYPGVIAAECIARSMLPRPCPNILFRC